MATKKRIRTRRAGRRVAAHADRPLEPLGRVVGEDLDDPLDALARDLLKTAIAMLPLSSPDDRILADSMLQKAMTALK